MNQKTEHGIHPIRGAKRKKNEEELRELLGDTIKMINYTLQGFENKRENGAESLFKEIMAENFPIVGKGTSRSRKPRKFQINSIQISPH